MSSCCRLISNFYNEKKMTRKKFISTTGKYVGGVVCTPMMLSLMSCGRVTAPNDDPPPAPPGTSYTSLCPTPCGHGSVFDQDGTVINGPATSNLISHQTEIINQNELIVNFDANSSETIDLNDHPNLLNESGNGVSSTDGLLLYRKNENTILALDRICPHSGCSIDPFNGS